MRYTGTIRITNRNAKRTNRNAKRTLKQPCAQQLLVFSLGIQDNAQGTDDFQDDEFGDDEENDAAQLLDAVDDAEVEWDDYVSYVNMGIWISIFDWVSKIMYSIWSFSWYREYILIVTKLINSLAIECI